MRKYFFLISILLIISSTHKVSASIDYEITFNKTYGGINTEYPSSAIETPDGYIIIGSTTTFGAGDSDIWAIKINHLGTPQWNKTYGTPSFESSHYIIQVNQNYLITGRSNYNTNGDMDLLLLLINNNGGLLWNKTIGGPGDEWMWEIEETTQGDYVMAGRTNSYGAGGNDYWLMKINSNGEILWNTTLGGEADDRARTIEIDQDGGYLINGWSSSYSKGLIDFWLVKTDQDGNPQWNKSYGTIEADRGVALTKTGDGYLLGGNTAANTLGSTDWLIVKTNTIGEIIWNRTYRGVEAETIHHIVQDKDGKYGLFGYTESFGSGSRDLYFIIIDNEGEVLLNKTYGGKEYEGSSLCIKTQDDGYLLGGHTYSYGNGDADFYIIKLNKPSSEENSSDEKLTEIPGFTLSSLLIAYLLYKYYKGTSFIE